ncbi:MAG: mucoidy inhibitor MuiA family protein [Chitinophagales bacterium]|nr:mucoidy inhibitor MuiA family protein [Chitinophagales bacterium]
MKNILSSIILGCIFLSVSAQSTQKPVESTIKKVTVFLNGAQITRQVENFPLTNGRNELVFKGISSNIDPQSIQLKGEGKFTIVSVAHQYNYLELTQTNDEVLKLQDQIKKIKKDLEDIKLDNEVLQNEVSILSKNQEIATRDYGVKVSELKESVDFQRERLTEVKMKILANNRKNKALTDSVINFNLQINAIQKKRNQPQSEVVVVIEAYDATKADFELSYYVSGSGWIPNYDIKVEQINEPIQFIYKAIVFQSTGEDWKNVQLTLSTGDPKLGGEKPIIKKWILGMKPEYIAQFQDKSKMTSNVNNTIRQVNGRILDASTSQPIIGAEIKVAGTYITTHSDYNGNFSVAVPQGSGYLDVSAYGYPTKNTAIISENQIITLYNGVDANIIVKPDAMVSSPNALSSLQGKVSGLMVQKEKLYQPLEVSEIDQTTTVSFTIEKPYTILSDGKTNAVEIKDVKIPANYQYYVAPIIDKDAFLTARIVEWEDLNLLEGEANLFFEGMYLGKSVINPKAYADTMEISLGRDKGIQVTRTKVKDFSKRQIIGGNKTELRTWEILVRNNKKQPVNIIVQDQYPLSNRKEVEVERIEHTEAYLDENRGLLTWNLNIAPSSEKKIGFKFSVKYPNYMDIFVP